MDCLCIKIFLRSFFIWSAMLWMTSYSLKTTKKPPALIYFDNLNMTKVDTSINEVNFEDGIKSYSGLITVDIKKKNHLFYWYFPAEINAEKAPLVFWLNGYATPSTYGIFCQTGPYILINGKLNKRNITWNKYYNMLHVDNPVGVGFSYTETNSYSSTLDDISKDLFNFLQIFYESFPNLTKNDLYISGTSSAGKYIPAFAKRIYNYNLKRENNINLKGLFIGNPYFDPSQINYGDYLYQHGFIDANKKSELDKKEEELQNYLKFKNYKSFYDKAKEYIVNNNSFVLNATGLRNRYDYGGKVPDDGNYKDFLKKEEIKQKLNVHNLEFNDGKEALKYFSEPYASSVKGHLENMLNDTKMLFYNGERDITWPYPTMTKVLESLKWKNADKYRNAPRNQIYVGDDLAGYIKSYGNLADVLVLNAAHSAISYQPEFVLNLFNYFTGYSYFF